MSMFNLYMQSYTYVYLPPVPKLMLNPHIGAIIAMIYGYIYTELPLRYVTLISQ